MSKSSDKQLQEKVRIPTAAEITAIGLLKNLTLREKIIFLNKMNLEILAGYKSFVELKYNGEIQITITGQKLDSARKMYHRLKAMKAEEVYGGDEVV